MKGCWNGKIRKAAKWLARRPWDRFLEGLLDGRSGRRPTRFPAGFTIEAAVVVPVALAVICLILQTVLYLHDTVWAQAWLCEQAWRIRWEQETGEDMPEGHPIRLSVLRCVGREETVRGRRCRSSASFQVTLLSHFVTLVFTGGTETVQKQAEEKAVDTPGFLRLVGAILEEDKE